MALTYSQMALQSEDNAFKTRVKLALVQIAMNVKIEALPPASTDVTQAAQEDRLARAILANKDFWASQFAELVAVQLIGKSTLLDSSVTTDGDIFSALSAIMTRCCQARNSRTAIILFDRHVRKRA